MHAGVQPGKQSRNVGSLTCFKQVIFPMEPVPMQSTVQADFIHHAHFQAPLPLSKDTSSILTKDQLEGKFQGLTSYSEDYTKKSARGCPRPLVASNPVYSRHFLQHAGCDKLATTYGDHFAPREGKGPKGQPDAPQGHPVGDQSDYLDSHSSSLTSFMRTRRFEGQTSYAREFNKPDISVPEEGKKTGDENQSNLTDAARACIFDSQSIYQESFLKHRKPVRQETLRPTGALHGGMAFSGISEYTSVYANWPRLKKWRLS
ncbi:unnamed protein product [Durusdinium trenchii]|uniref:Uncharacterized protein n=2 Tax=Durusdinium trenchii TaxID=1381693 RepID=A0ABP0R0Y6_9DINO